MPRVRRVLLLAGAALALAAAWAPQAAADDPVIGAAGDIACDPADPFFNGGAGDATHCRQRATSDLLLSGGLAAVLPLGDLQYNAFSADRVAASYNPSWGRVKSISHPVLGNHESAGNTYFDYFNDGADSGPAGTRGQGYYSFDVGAWHLVALNSNCAYVSCAAGSAQERWLRADLAAHQTSCTLAYWHHPRWSSGHQGSSSFMQPLWKALSDYGADVLLSAHSHDYERFAPQDANGRKDTAYGIRQFVVGTGGVFFTGWTDTAANSEIRNNSSFGVLRLTLRPTSYDWQFAPVPGHSLRDSGADLCHGPPAPPPSSSPVAPTAPSRAASPIRIAGLPKRCVRRNFRLRIRVRLTTRLARARVYVDGRRGRLRRRGRFRALIRARRLRPGRHRITVVAIDRAGVRAKRTVRFRRCAPRRS